MFPILMPNLSCLHFPIVLCVCLFFLACIFFCSSLLCPIFLAYYYYMLPILRPTLPSSIISYAPVLMPILHYLDFPMPHISMCILSGMYFPMFAILMRSFALLNCLICPVFIPIRFAQNFPTHPVILLDHTHIHMFCFYTHSA